MTNEAPKRILARIDYDGTHDGTWLACAPYEPPHPYTGGEPQYIRADLVPSWQPIETIPVSFVGSDGCWSEVIVWNTKYERCDLCRVGTDRIPMWGDWDIPVEASHWMPLPEPPK